MSVCHVSFSADTVIPGHCQMYIPVSHSQKERGSGVLEPAVSFMEQQGLIIARSVCSMEKGSSIIRVLNPSPAPIAVYSNQKVGILHPLSKAEGVCALKSWTKAAGKTEKTQATLEEAVKLMTSRAKDLSSVDIECLQSLLFWIWKRDISRRWRPWVYGYCKTSDWHWRCCSNPTMSQETSFQPERRNATPCWTNAVQEHHWASSRSLVVTRHIGKEGWINSILCWFS